MGPNQSIELTLLNGLEQESVTAYSMVLLSLVTSMNIAELLGLRWKRVNLSDQPMMIDGRLVDGPSVSVRENFYRGVFGTVKAKSRLRDLPITAPVVEALTRVKALSSFTEPDDLVFSTDKGTPHDEKNLMRRVIKPIAVELKMPWMGWHVLRHTHATLSERIGMALTDRQDQMGHADYRMTLHYTHGDMERRRAGLTALTDRLVRRPAEAKSTETGSDLTLTDTKNQEQIAVNY